MTILLTGATGFVGHALCRHLLAAGHRVVAPVRRDGAFLPLGVEARWVGELGPQTDWRQALKGVKTVIHLAARAHHMGERSRSHMDVYTRINRDGTLRLAEQAVQAGVTRFVYVSTIKVNGESADADHPFRATDAPNPSGAYALSKAEAELGLAGLAVRTGLSVAVLRPPLVHGPGVKGNLAALMALIGRGLPLPFGAIVNARSLVGVDNLAHGLCFLADHSAVGTFLIRDGQDVSTPDLVRGLARHMGVPARLLAVPPALMHGFGALLGRGQAMHRLTGSLVVDDTPLRALGWSAPHDLDHGLALMAAGRRL